MLMLLAVVAAALPPPSPRPPASSVCYERLERLSLTEGYYCIGTAVLDCPKGHVCYADANTLTAVYRECTSKELCLIGFSEPKPCPSLAVCSHGHVVFEPIMGILVGLLLGCAGLLALCVSVRRARMLRQQDDARALVGGGAGGARLGEGLVAASPVHVEFRDVGMTIRATKATVLHDVNGSFPAGSLVALMGPSGGGKTTFMNALLDRAPYGNVAGSFAINGVAGGFAHVPSLVGYVPQDDIVHANLTVYENLFYNAMLRLPRDVAKPAKIEHVIHVLEVLGLTPVRNHLVGDAARRGISGGQKKRVNIGVELAAMPSILFMDEPTSGLDGAATVELARCLGQLRLSGLTIICVLHQPRLAVYEEFTHLLLLGQGGQQVYFGRAERAEAYLTSLGFRMPPRENVADWLIDVVCGLAPRHTPDGALDDGFAAPQDLYELWAQRGKPAIFQPDSQWTEGFEPPAALRGAPVEPLVPRQTLGRAKQAYYMLGRSFRQHDMPTLIVTCAILFAASSIFGHLMTQAKFPGIAGVGYTYTHVQQWMTGYSAATPLYFLFCACFTRPLFARERLTYAREQKAGVSSVGYFGARCAYNLALLPFLATAFSLGLFLFSRPAQGYGTYLLAALLSAWFWSGAAILVANLVSSDLIATLALIFWPLLEPTISGSYLLQSTPRTAPLSCLTCSRWNMQILLAAEAEALPYHTLGIGFLPMRTQLHDGLMPLPTSESEAPAAFRRATRDAALALLGLGLAFRLLGLLLMALLKYSQGGGYLAQLRYVARRVAFKLGGASGGVGATDHDPDAAAHEHAVLGASRALHASTAALRGETRLLGLAASVARSLGALELSVRQSGATPRPRAGTSAINHTPRTVVRCEKFDGAPGPCTTPKL